MEFLLSDAGSAARLDPAGLERVLVGRAPLAAHLGGRLLHNGDPRDALLFDGSATFAGGHVSSWLPVAAGDAGRLLAAVAANDASGVFCFVAVEGEAVRVGTDTLSQYPVFVHHMGARYFISNNLFLIERALAQVGAPTGRSVADAFTSLGLNGGFGTDSGIEGVRLLPAYSEAVAGAEGLRIVVRLERSALYHRRRLARVENPALRLRAQVDAALARYGPETHVVSGLTGGRDSRITMALLATSPRAAEVRYWCGGAFPDPDKIAFVNLVRRFGLQTPPFDLSKSSAYTPGLEEEIRVGLSRHGVATLAEFLRFGVYATPGVLSFAGYFGEFARGGGFFADVFRAHRAGEAGLDRIAARLAVEKPFYTAEGLAFLRGRVAAALAGFGADGVGPEGLGLAHYVENRSRGHFGAAAKVRLGAGPAIYPLADLGLVRAAMQHAPADVERGGVSYRLIRDLHSEALALAPMAEAVWPAAVAPRGAAQAPIRRGDARGLEDITWARSPLLAEAGAPRVQRAPRPKGMKRAAALMQECQPLLAMALEELGSTHDLFRLVDIDAARAMAAPDYAPTEAKARRWVPTLTAACLWLMAGETHQRRTEVATFPR